MHETEISEVKEITKEYKIQWKEHLEQILKVSWKNKCRQIKENMDSVMDKIAEAKKKINTSNTFVALLSLSYNFLNTFTNHL